MQKLTLALALITPLSAQTAYTIVETNSMFGDPVTMTVYRNGSKAVVDNVHGTTHTRSLYDLAAHTQQSWDLAAVPASCSNGTFSGDWGDPYATMTELKAAKQTGTETINGVATKTLELDIPGGKAKAWVDANGLVMKLQMGQGSDPMKTMLEVTRVTMTAPPASLFVLPASCAAEIAATPPPPKIAPDFVKAIMPPGERKSGPCSVSFRVMKGDAADANSLQPVTTGFKMSMGPAEQPMHDVTAQVRNGVLRIDNAPDSFNLGVDFANGSSFGLIYRQCFSPQTVLLLIVKNPAKVTDGADWFWVKSEKFKP